MAKPMAFTVRVTGTIRYTAREDKTQPISLWEYSITSGGDAVSRLHLVSAALDLLLACTPDELRAAEDMLVSKRTVSAHNEQLARFFQAGAGVAFGDERHG